MDSYETVTLNDENGERTYRAYKNVRFWNDDICEYIFLINTLTGKASAMSRNKFEEVFSKKK